MKTGIFTPKEALTEHQTSPKLANALLDVLPMNKPVIDFGCGRGEYLANLEKYRYKVEGYEGQPLADSPKFIKKADITIPIETKFKGSVLCLEVMEHIPSELTEVAMSNLINACTGRLILSWAIKGQGGCGHVNEQDSDYVVPLIESKGFKYNVGISSMLRSVAGRELWWFKNSIYVFDKTK